MVETLSPGVYVSYTDQSLYAATNVPSVGLILGLSHQGTSEPFFCTNSDAFLNEFGPPTGDTYFHYAALSYLKSGRFLWVRRIMSASAAVGSVDILDVSSVKTLEATTRSKTDSYNGYKIDVTTDTSLDQLPKKSQISSIEFIGVVAQPVNVTGVVLTNPTGVTISGVALSFTSSGTTLSWGGGTPVNVLAGGSFVLTNLTGTSSVTAIVTPANLPSGNQADSLNVTASIPLGAFSPISGVIFSAPSGTLGQHTITVTYVSATSVTLKLDAGSSSISIHNQNTVTITSSTGSLTANIVRYGFKLVLSDSNSNVLETLTKLSKDPNSTYYHVSRVLSLSKYLLTIDTTSNYKVPKVSSTSYLLSGGNSGMSGVVSGDYIGSYSSSVKLGLNGFLNSEDYNIDFVNIPGQVDTAIVTAMLDFCATRGDCMALIDTPSGITSEEAVDWTNGTGAYAGQTAFNSMFGECFHDWATYYDPYTDSYLDMPPTVPYLNLLAIAYSLGKQYQAIAGYNRGQVLDALDIKSSPDQSERDNMLADSLGNCVNPYVKFVRDGIILFGEKTMQRKNSSTNRAHAVRTLLYLFKQIKQIAKTVLFEPNDASTWRTLSATIEPILNDLKSAGKRGLYDARFVCDTSTNTPAVIDQNKVAAKLYVKFMKNAEMIEINIIATDTGADFSLV